MDERVRFVGRLLDGEKMIEAKGFEPSPSRSRTVVSKILSCFGGAG